MTLAPRFQIRLEPMSDADFAAFVEASIPAYASDKVGSGQWTQEQAVDLARKALEDLLPQGLRTADHHLYNVIDDAGRRVGTLWLAVREQAGQPIAYVYDIFIRPEYRRQGNAMRALEAAEAEAHRLGLRGIGLHVFGHNLAARSLYEKLGYRTTNVNMFKPL